MSNAAAGATEVVATFVARPRAASPHTGALARTLVDTVAVAIAGLATEETELLLDWLVEERAPGPATVWGSDLTLAPSQAALVNGMAAHVLDWDDAVPGIPFHPGAVMIPALLAQLAVEDAPGERLVAAYDVGQAVSRAVSEVLPISDHYGRGWHNTSTTGRLAGTAAVAHLAGLDVDHTRHALGLIASTAAGSLANFGTMTKSLHAGMAARDAVMAVSLARRGFTANTTQLEDRRGFFRMYGETTPELLATLGERLDRWESAWVDDWALKRYPSCYATHRAIDGALELRDQIDDPAQVTAITVSQPYAPTSPLLDLLPDTGLEGKFSLQYTVARAVASGRVELADFTDERVQDPGVRRLFDLIEIDNRHAEIVGAGGGHTSVTIRLADGRELRSDVAVTFGDSRRPISDDQVTEKFTSALTAVGWKPAATAALAERLWSAPAQGPLGWLQDALRARS